MPKAVNSSAANRLLRLKPAAAYLSVSPGTLRVIIQRGELPIIKLAENGHSPWLIDRVELDAWIERSKVIFRDRTAGHRIEGCET